MATDSPIDDPLQVTSRVAAALESLGVRYLVGGSLSSSLYGIPRATQDIDIVAELRTGNVPAFIERLSVDFFVDDERVRTAVAHGETFNVVDRQSLIKVDVFICGGDQLAREEMDRRVAFDVPGLTAKLFLSTPEDIICHKLQWFRLGGGVSDRQWSDVINVLKVQEGRLDSALMNRVASARGVSDLLARALEQAAP